MTNLGIVGCGRRGREHLKALHRQPHCELVMVADADPERLSAMLAEEPTVITTTDPALVLENPAIDAVVLATPAATHFDLARQALLFDKDLLCERPLALRRHEAEELAALAKARGRILMVGHASLFNSGIRRLKGAISFGDCGTVRYLQVTSTGQAPTHSDTSIVFDVACRQVAILNHLLDQPPTSVSACGQGHRDSDADAEEAVSITLAYSGGIAAHLYVNRLTPNRSEQITVVGDRHTLTWNAPPEPESPDPLRAQASHFLACVRRRLRPINDGRVGTDTVATLEAIDASLHAEGVPVTLGKPLVIDRATPQPSSTDRSRGSQPRNRIAEASPET